MACGSLLDCSVDGSCVPVLVLVIGRGVIYTSEAVWRTTFQVPGVNVERAQLCGETDPNCFVAEAKNLRDVQIYLWFARFLVWQVEQMQGRTVAHVTDVRFFRENAQEI